MLNSPLHTAVENNRPDEVKRLAEDIASIDIFNDLDFTPLEMALLLGKGDCALALGYRPPDLKVVFKCQHIVSHLDTKSFLEAMGVVYTPCSLFESRFQLIKTINAKPWFLNSTFLGKDALNLGEIYKDRIFNGDAANLTIVWMDDLGYGVITNRNLSAGEFIGCYAGLVRKVHRFTPLINGYCALYPTRWYGGGVRVIDASRYGNALRYINHSDTPNLKAAWALDRGLLHLLFFAAEDIPRGAPLLIDYGEAYWQYRLKRQEGSISPHNAEREH